MDPAIFTHVFIIICSSHRRVLSKLECVLPLHTSRGHCLKNEYANTFFFFFYPQNEGAANEVFFVTNVKNTSFIELYRLFFCYFVFFSCLFLFFGMRGYLLSLKSYQTMPACFVLILKIYEYIYEEYQVSNSMFHMRFNNCASFLFTVFFQYCSLHVLLR